MLLADALLANAALFAVDDGDGRLDRAAQGVAIHLLEEAAARTGVDQVIGWRCEPAAGLIMWDDWLADSSSAPPRTDLAARPHLHYTSGTTGFPKGTETPPAMYIGGATVAEQYELIKELSLIHI